MAAASSTKVLVFIAGIFFIILLFALASSEESMTYAEGYYANEATPLTITISETNIRYNVTGYALGAYDGFVFQKNGVYATRSGLYRFVGSVSYLGGNGGEYGMGMTRNYVPLQKCGMGSTASASIIQNVGFTCIVELTAGDLLHFVVKDANAPPQDIQIYKMNINIYQMQ